MSRRGIAAMVAGVMVLGASAAWAADFSPTTRFTFSSLKKKANPGLRIVVQQGGGEEELAEVTLKLPRGYNVAQDKAIAGGTQIGAGEITIEAGPACAGAPAGSAPANVPVRILEKDRTGAQELSGVKAVWLVDLEPVTRIELVIKGSVKRGWTLSGVIPSNAMTCPPLVFDATIQAKAGNVKIITNPAKAGRYRLEAIYRGIGGGTASTKQTVRIR